MSAIVSEMVQGRGVVYARGREVQPRQLQRYLQVHLRRNSQGTVTVARIYDMRDWCRGFERRECRESRWQGDSAVRGPQERPAPQVPEQALGLNKNERARGVSAQRQVPGRRRDPA